MQSPLARSVRKSVNAQETVTSAVAVEQRHADSTSLESSDGDGAVRSRRSRRRARPAPTLALTSQSADRIRWK
jgi:hypothetical protein